MTVLKRTAISIGDNLLNESAALELGEDWMKRKNTIEGRKLLGLRVMLDVFIKKFGSLRGYRHA